MGSSNKTTILLSKATHQQLCQLARERGQTLDQLMQQVCASRHRDSRESVRRSTIAIEEGDDEGPDRTS
jgi:predicted DNA-binding ribbon-helix-helix protein